MTTLLELLRDEAWNGIGVLVPLLFSLLIVVRGIAKRIARNFPQGRQANHWQAIEDWDTKALRGIPSKGLFEVIEPDDWKNRNGPFR